MKIMVEKRRTTTSEGKKTGIKRGRERKKRGKREKRERVEFHKW